MFLRLKSFRSAEDFTEHTDANEVSCVVKCNNCIPKNYIIYNITLAKSLLPFKCNEDIIKLLAKTVRGCQVSMLTLVRWLRATIPKNRQHLLLSETFVKQNLPSFKNTRLILKCLFSYGTVSN